jgi:hypothetical protein
MQPIFFQYSYTKPPSKITVYIAITGKQTLLTKNHRHQLPKLPECVELYISTFPSTPSSRGELQEQFCYKHFLLTINVFKILSPFCNSVKIIKQFPLPKDMRLINNFSQKLGYLYSYLNSLCNNRKRNEHKLFITWAKTRKVGIPSFRILIFLHCLLWDNRGTYMNRSGFLKSYSYCLLFISYFRAVTGLKYISPEVTLL